MYHQELEMIRSQALHKQGANNSEIVRIKTMLAAGRTCEQISSDLLIALPCIESFAGKPEPVLEAKADPEATDPFAGMKRGRRGK